MTPKATGSVLVSPLPFPGCGSAPRSVCVCVCGPQKPPHPWLALDLASYFFPTGAAAAAAAIAAALTPSPFCRRLSPGCVCRITVGERGSRRFSR